MSIVKRVFLGVMGLLYVFGGVMHLIRPDAYLPMMPPFLPLHRELIFLSGLAEIAVGVGVWIPQTRRLAAWGTILLLIAVFPANIYVAIHDIPLFGAQRGAGLGNWIRLPIQLLLIWWAYQYTKPAAPGARSATAREQRPSAT